MLPTVARFTSEQVKALRAVGVEMVDVDIPTTDGRMLILPRHTEPQAEQQMLLDKVDLTP